MEYNYYEAVKDDVIQYIEDNGLDFAIKAFEDEDDKIEHLENLLWCEDSVTGNASGSYTFSSWQAEENLCHNFELVRDVASEYEINLINATPEDLDVAIRCYLLRSCINKALIELDYI